MIRQAKVLTVSDSVSQGTRDDRSGDSLVQALQAQGFNVVERRVIPDGVDSVSTALTDMSADFAGLLITCGGTGFSPTDLTPEATIKVLERQAPGLAEAMRAVSPLGRLSRGLAGTIGQCLILNVPGSTSGSSESFHAVAEVLPHALELLAGEHPH